MKSTFGTPEFGPFPDGTVQTYFRESPPHWNQAGTNFHSDFQLVTPHPTRDMVQKLDHLPLMPPTIPWK